MKKWCIIAMVFVSSIVVGQKNAIGVVRDEAKIPLTGTTVVLLDKVDSSMVAFAISDHKGRFLLEDVPSGNFILQLSFLSYRTTYKNVDVSNDTKQTDLGIFTLESKSEILQEVTVKAEHIPMGIIGDTISYNAAAFKTRPGASVEDLLKKLPGVEVQRDGSIKAMGEDVRNVLVDGKEFFGDDPKVATKNLEAEAVDKVELYDKKSEIAEFTGIDDGQDEKTINLKLKEEYRKGGFGKMEVAKGSDQNYKGKLNYNRFSPSMQAATILSANNINEQSFSFNEYMQFMGGLSNAIAENNGMINFGEMGGNLSPRGVADDFSGGLNFNYDFSSKVKLTSHYIFLRNDKETNSQVRSSQFSESGIFETLDSSSYQNENNIHQLNAKIKYKINPYTEVIFKNSFNGQLANNKRESMTSFLQNAGDLTMSLQPDSKKQFGYESNLQYRRKFDKKGRNWITSTKIQIGQFDQNIDVLNSSYFGGNQTLLHQHQNVIYNNLGFNVKSSYTEPLGHKTYLAISYRSDRNRETPSKDFYNIEGDLSILDNNLSASFEKINQIHFAELSLRKNRKNLKMKGGLGLQRSHISNSVVQENTTFHNISKNFLPRFSLEYEINGTDNIDFNYATSINLPTLNQLSPLPDNGDPNILNVGNPDLNPEYNHTLNLGYRSFDQFNYRNLFLRTSVSIIRDRIINSVSIDDQFLKILQPINTNLYKSISGYASYSAPIRPLQIKYRVSTRYRLADYTSLINLEESDVTESNVNINVLLENRKKEHMDIASGIRLELNHRDYKIQESYNQLFLNYKLFVDGVFYLGKWTFASSFDYVSYSGEFFSSAQSFQLWNASIQRMFLGEKVSVKVDAFDMLNQNKGISRTGTINGLIESNYNTLTRYVMIGLTYKLGKKKEGGVTFAS